MRVEETIQQKKARAISFRLFFIFIAFLFSILMVKVYTLQITFGEKARLQSENYEDVVVKKSIFNDQYYSSEDDTSNKGINSTNQK
jgi:cell division protein FtsI/penicillin-binding protein 2